VTLAGRATRTENRRRLLDDTTILTARLSIPWQDVRADKTTAISGT
jgi:hypothetical protein